MSSIIQDWHELVVTNKDGSAVLDGSGKPFKTGMIARRWRADDGKEYVQIQYCTSVKVGTGPSSVYHATTGKGMVNLGNSYLSIRAGTVVKRQKQREQPKPAVSELGDNDFPNL